MQSLSFSQKYIFGEEEHLNGIFINSIFICIPAGGTGGILQSNFERTHVPKHLLASRKPGILRMG
jgi:hypothetical protein